MAVSAPGAATAIEWDATDKVYVAQPGETKVTFAFTAINRTTDPIQIYEAVPSCGCTTVQLPADPWLLATGASETLRVTVDFTGKRGRLEKAVTVRSSAGESTLNMVIDVPEESAADRTRRVGNQQAASVDRQAVLRESCAGCHVPAKMGLSGAEIFQGVCAICHESPHRASMVPNLAERGAGRDAGYWLKWIESGRDRSLMPAFARDHGGILTPEQVEQLVNYLVARFRTER
jgi:mono/diheme cytochrome c family protein